MEDTDEALVRDILGARSDHAFLALYRRHSPRVFRVALRLTSDKHDAEDVLQETWLRGTQKLAGFRWESTFSTWITGIAANVSREVLHRRRKWEHDTKVSEPLAYAPERADMIDLERAIAMLPAAQRAAFILHDVEGFTHEDVARHMSWTSGTSKSHLSRARRSLAERLSELKRGLE